LGDPRPLRLGRVRTRVGRRHARAVARRARSRQRACAPHAAGRRAAEPDANRPAARGERPSPARRDMTEGPSLAALLDGDPSDVVVHAHDQATTRAELQAMADALASQLRAGSLDRQAIGVLAPNGPGAIAAWFAVWRVGGAFVPLNPRVPDAERERAIASTGVAAVVEPPVLRLQPDAPPR